MKYILVALIILTVSCSHFKPKDPFEDINMDHLMGLELPDKNVPQWVRLEYLGTINHPPTVVFLSPTKFKEFHDGPYEFSFISENEYLSLIKFIHNHICLSEASEASIGKSYLVITEHSPTKNNICYIQGTNASHFFKELYELNEISWSKSSLQSLGYLNNEFP